MHLGRVWPSSLCRAQVLEASSTDDARVPPMTSEVFAALVGALVAGGVALLAQLIARRQTRTEALDDQRAKRIGDFLAATHSAVLAIGGLALLPEGDGQGSKGPALASSEMATIRDRVNMVINTIQLLEDSPVVTAAAELDRCLVRLEDEAMASQWSRDGWRTRRNEVLGAAVDDVYAAGRRALRRAPLARAQLWSSADRRGLGRVGANAPATTRPPYGS